jgi:hypothetical protein
MHLAYDFPHPEERNGISAKAHHDTDPARLFQSSTNMNAEQLLSPCTASINLGGSNPTSTAVFEFTLAVV